MAETIAILLITLLTNCSSFNEDDTGIAIKLSILVEDTVSEQSFSSDKPFHVMAFSREKACKPFLPLFESDAYVTKDGQIKWVGKQRYWPGVFTKFIAYWPAESNVELDEKGHILSSDCILIAETEPYYQFSENPTLIFHSPQN
ncbi:MAG: hypothetical protein K2N34_13635 [Lachnospiraceae bacterium]|nr:hypothetical protein [Lachnospiraceae bacterium]